MIVDMFDVFVWALEVVCSNLG